MCSTPPRRIAEIGQAIDDLAAQALAVHRDRTRPGDADLVAIRVAELWAQIAELDPEVARRLPTYQAD